jgi:hypothetical protein
MLLFNGPHRTPTSRAAARHQRKSSLRRAHAGQRLKHCAKPPPDFDSQPRAMRFISTFGSECPPDEHDPRHISGPRFA